MGEVNSVTVTVRPNASEVYWSTVVVNARQFGFGILLFVIVILFFAAGSLFHWLNPTEGAGWYHLLEKSGPVLGICSFPVLMIFVGAAVTTKRFFLELSNTLGVTYRFSDAGIEVEPSVGNPHLGWSDFQNAIETRTSFLLFTSDGQKRVIPKRCLAGGLPEIRVLREILRCCVSSFKLRED